MMSIRMISLHNKHIVHRTLHIQNNTSVALTFNSYRNVDGSNYMLLAVDIRRVMKEVCISKTPETGLF